LKNGEASQKRVQNEEGKFEKEFSNAAREE
jgi:hypothetical protein